MRKIKVDKDNAGQPVYVEQITQEHPPAVNVYWLKRDPKGNLKSKDGRRWMQSVAYYRPSKRNNSNDPNNPEINWKHLGVPALDKID